MTRVVPAVARALSVLELFLGDRSELTSRDITESLGLPRTSAHELTNTLVQLGYLAPGLVDRRAFRLGVKVLQLGSTYTERLDLAVEGRPVAERVANECAETVHIAILDASDVVYMVKIDSTRSVRMVSAQGRRIAAHCTSIGKMLLSRLTDAELDALYGKEELVTLTPHSISTLTELKAALAIVREKQVAFENMESNPEVACVAAPVYDHTGTMSAAMSISVPIIRWNNNTPEQWAKLASTGAGELSYRLGAPPRLTS
jgi:IclR family KDG regulon transcriptional repressor